MNGFLDTKGVLHECSAWEHLDKASNIVEQMGVAVTNRLEAEEYLQKLGWIVVRTHDVYGMIGYHLDGKEERIHLTVQQKTWLEEYYGSVDSKCQKSIDKLFEWDK